MEAAAAAPPAAPVSTGGFSDAGNAGSRYDALLRQIVQLNTDLQKTAALSQTLQRERDDAQQISTKLKGEVKRLHERCDKMQLVLMQETEQKIESDRKHEELISKWKKQLEVKARAFESLQKKFAPPRDLEQLRIKIQEELEGPYQQRIDNLQDEMERQRQMSFDMRREYEALKTEYEQFSIDQGNEMECLQETYEVTLNDLRRKLQLAEETAANSQHVEKVRRLEQQREAAQIEIKALRDEVRVAAQEEALRRCQNEAEETTHKLQMENESLQKMVQALEKEVMVAKQTSSQELLKYMEQDYAVLVEKLDKEKENHVATARDLHKRDAYKRKCLEIHESYKQLVDEANRREAKLLQCRQDHTAELQQLLAQLSEAESDKTALMQRQIELGFPPSIFTKKVIAIATRKLCVDRC
ncbi:hypothetical protein AM588_10008065 [Phytophthora nicotianae]|uniref:Uncharacterized protein n=1 Tax=Phytophthora nicotianae TaxID=4792 RepID=A0A0W8DAV9_PHYNI|nr:hypothetical protein AM588_10008065 [Phytophthora nicotianae]